MTQPGADDEHTELFIGADLFIGAEVVPEPGAPPDDAAGPTGVSPDR